MKELPLRYKEHTLIPDDIVNGVKNRNEKYSLASGDVVTIEYRRTCVNKNGKFDDELEESCQELYGMPFTRVRSHWIARLGKVSDCWHWVKLHKV